MGDDELMKRICQGDETAAEELIGRYYLPILRYCRWRCGNRETAEDLTQETFLRLFRFLSGYREQGRFKAYLFSIANRLCTDESRKTPLYPLEDGEGPAAEDSRLRQTEDRDELRCLLAGLPPEQREAVLLRFGERLPYRDIARITGCTMRTAQSRVKYALNAMRRKKRHE